ncbi:D-ribose pyranase [Clostridiaceae bacterium HSG29]|nr:D-ribose pyranase [Clostridiaceae bacterium HSG29]
MKKGKLLNSNISSVISKLGHTDMITVCDSGLPIPNEVERIDLALTMGVPSFIETLEIILTEQFVEVITVAKEFKENNLKVYNETIEIIKKVEKEQGNNIKIVEISHEDFKILTSDSKAIVRTGEITPYSNIILHSGVVF